MKKIITKIHLWLSVPFGLVITILCLTGALLIFEAELQALFKPSMYKAKIVDGERMSISELMPLVKAQLPDSVEISNVQIPTNPKNNYRMGVSGQGRTSLLVDPYTGEIKGTVVPYQRGTFYSFIRRAHRWLLLPTNRGDGISWGKMVTGTTTLVFVFIMISGIIIWVPKSIKMVKTRLKIKTNASRFRFWYDTHIAGGMWVVLLLLAMALTGLTWSFNWYRDGFYRVFGVQTVQGGVAGGQQNVQVQQGQSGRQSHGEDSGINRESRGERSVGRGSRGGGQGDERGPSYSIWDNVYESLSRMYPKSKAITIQDGTASVSINKRGNTRGADSYTFDPRTGELTVSQLYKDQNKAAKIRGWIYAVHVGSWGGIFTRILYFIACIIGASLPVTGYYIYLKKWSVRRKNRLKRAAR